MGVVVKDEADKRAEEAEERRRLLRKQMLAGQFSGRPTDVMNPTPGFRYKGINKKRIEQAKAKLFEPIPDTDPANFLGAMGKEKVFGDLVLMREPMEIYQAKVRRNEQRFASKQDDKQEEILDELNRIGRNSKAVGAHKKAVFDIEQTEE